MKMRFLITCFTAILFSGEILAQNAPQVTTQNGVLEGVDSSGVKIFKGVPFAAPPVGALRWKAPQPVKNWQGVRKATEYGPNPMQENVFGDMDFGTPKMSEDCLYLNIWTPAKTMKEKLPVVIYFNGGGLMAGSGSEPRYAGLTMARRGIVAVTANYREGIFGFFAHPQLSKETTYKGSGNYGFLDQVAALKWLKENIAAFGGDPDHITVAGESAGSMSVSILMASPLAKGLFQQAIGSSGSVMGFKKLPTLKEAEQMGVEQAKKMGFKNISDLRALPAEKLMKLASVHSVPVYNLDSYFMSEQPVDVYAKGAQAQVPLLVGGNSLEMPIAFILGKNPATLGMIKAFARPIFGNRTDEVLNLYGLKSDADVLKTPGDLFSNDNFIAYSTWKWSNLHQKTTSQPVYRYLYCHPRPDMVVKDKVAGLAGGVQDAKGQAPQPKLNGAVHSADIEYAMGNLPTNRVYDWQPEDYVVSDIFNSYYVNFIKTGNPNGLGLPEWVPINGKAVPEVLQIDVNTVEKTDPEMENRYHVIDSIIYGNK
jgi:para-nitrobenzyl esterase